MEELFEPLCSNHRQLRQQMHSVTAVGSKSTLLKSRTTLWYSTTTATHSTHTNTGQTWQSAEHRTPLQPKIPAGFRCIPVTAGQAQLVSPAKMFCRWRLSFKPPISPAHHVPISVSFFFVDPPPNTASQIRSSMHQHPLPPSDTYSLRSSSGGACKRNR